MKIQEIQVSASWGHIAVKLWGHENNTVILCFHGLLDNAGSFNKLIPYLPSCFFIYASIYLAMVFPAISHKNSYYE
ncbi:hypothetical protein Trydic_g7724 [Trypoxylus dichotomus]